MNLDDVHIAFSQDQLWILNLCLAFLMFGVALDIHTSDFKALLRKPFLPVIGIISQLLLLPILTIILVYVFGPVPSIGLGMVLIGICPGGNVSNFMVHISGSNTALSVTLTSVVTLLAAVYTPFSFAFWSTFVPDSESLRQEIEVPAFEMIKTIVLLIVIPLIIGMWINHQYPSLKHRIAQPTRRLSLLLFGSFVIVAIMTNYENFIAYLPPVFAIVMVHNISAFALGYGWSKAWKLKEADARAISIETGIQNSGLALILIFNFFDGLGGMALIAAWWGIWHLLSGFILASYWSRRGQSNLGTGV